MGWNSASAARDWIISLRWPDCSMSAWGRALRRPVIWRSFSGNAVQPSRSSTEAKCRTSPGASTVAPVILRPLTKVPFVLSRSRIERTSPAREISACSQETRVDDNTIGKSQRRPTRNGSGRSGVHVVSPLSGAELSRNQSICSLSQDGCPVVAGGEADIVPPKFLSSRVSSGALSWIERPDPPRREG